MPITSRIHGMAESSDTIFCPTKIAAKPSPSRMPQMAPRIGRRERTVDVLVAAIMHLPR